ncbi:MAG: DMT family protein [Sphingobacteriales bacterium]|nr:DMT family protein [Sphingobacteriales bacterium]
MKAAFTVFMLSISNIFMTMAWYGHLRFKDMEWSKNLGLLSIILLSWSIALLEYLFQVPANRVGFKGDGGPFSLLQLKIIQETLSITVFVVFTLLFFKTEKIAWNHIVSFAFILLAVLFAFWKSK